MAMWTLCCVTYDVIQGSLPLTYEWFNENGDLVATTEDLENVTEAPQNYRLVITDSNGCVYEYEFFIDLENSVHDEYNIRDYINVFPNPASECLKINFINEVAKRAMIHDQTGRQILVDSQLNKNHELRVQYLEAGVYLLRLEFENGPKIAYFIKE